MAEAVTGGLTADEEDFLIELLLKATQPYSPRFFEALAQKIPVQGIEVVVFRLRDGKTQVLLTRRPDTSESWPGQWQSPGTILRESDTNLYDAIRRLEKEEIGANYWSLRLAYFTVPPRDGTRARNSQVVFVADLNTEDDHNGTWFDIDDLPEGIIPTQAAMVLKADRLRNEGMLIPVSRF